MGKSSAAAQRTTEPLNEKAGAGISIEFSTYLFFSREIYTP